MTELFLSDRAKAKIFNAACDAETDYIEEIRHLSTLGMTTLPEAYLRGRVHVLAELMTDLELDHEYDEWLESPAYDETEEI